MRRPDCATIFVIFATAILAVAGFDDRLAAQGGPAAAGSNAGVRWGPTRSGYVDVDGGRFHYLMYGDLATQGTPLLVLHGSYMSAEAMTPLIHGFASVRPVIAFDARGHGRTGDLPGPITYEQMADDAAGVLDALKVRRADVLGYSMGGTTAITMAVRHPGKVAKQVVVSGPFRRDGWYPEVNEALAQAEPAAFAGTPLEAEYRRTSPTPNAFPLLVSKLRALDENNYEMSDNAVRAIAGKTMVVVGDADGIELEHAVRLFRLRGGGDRKVAVQGYMTAAPRARLAILPGTSHLGIMANAPLIAELATPFLDDTRPAIPPGFLKDHPDGRQ